MGQESWNRCRENSIADTFAISKTQVGAYKKSVRLSEKNHMRGPNRFSQVRGGQTHSKTACPQTVQELVLSSIPLSSLGLTPG